MKRAIAIILTLITLSAGTYFLFLHSPPPMHVIKRMIEGFECEQPAEVHKHLSENYKDDYGHTYSNLPEQLQRVFDVIANPTVIVDQKKLEYRRNKLHHAVVRLKFKLIAEVEGMRGYIIGNPTQSATAEVEMVKEKDGWKVVKVTLYDVGVPILRPSDENAD